MFFFKTFPATKQGIAVGHPCVADRRLEAVYPQKKLTVCLNDCR